MEHQVQQKVSTRNTRYPWLTSLLAVFYLALLVAALWWPGATLLERLRWLDSGICAQLLTHSLYPGGKRLPLCSRNTGIYLGFFVTMIMLFIRKRGRAQALPGKSLIIALCVGIFFLAVDGTNSLFVDLGIAHLYQPNNLLRLASGLLAGLAMGVFVLPVINGLIWRHGNTQRSLPAWIELGWFLPILFVCFYAAASQSGLALYPLAILSTLGLLTAVGGINLIFILLLSKRDESFTRYTELIPFCGFALLAATGELLLLAQLKLSLFQALGIPLS
ncbi:hypothetical protein KDH_34710 [Dictyobacter sp. S3.2.2.5]|uniref:DUF2085 domain-containing protein n=1 Tax=Dictyobacter halimunensis TaxID=3026934 RepID=A0ABQ6FUC2_9CHLR|nr:hypothetical protein KDH_34710 [Dictyobacter sp. S3.2.2.5]